MLHWLPQLTEGWKGVSNGTSTQVRVQITNKYKVMMTSRRLYKKGSPHEEGDKRKKESRGTAQTTVIFEQGPIYAHFNSSD